MKSITIRADEHLIQAAREQARIENTTLNEQVRRWLADYTQKKQQAKLAKEVVEELRAKISTGGRKFTRDEMNER